MAAPAASLALNAGPIRRPDRPAHSMVIEPLVGRVTARVGDTVVADSRAALIVRETGPRALAPVVYFPPESVRGALLRPADRLTTCPLKGTARHYDLVAGSGADVIERVAWSYRRVHTFDPRLAELEGCVAFDPEHVEVTVR